MLDNTYLVTTPELVTIRLRPAGIGPRMLAWIIDLGLQVVLVGFASLVFLLIGSLLNIRGSGYQAGAFLIFSFLLFWFYSAVFETLNKGRTPGKMVMGLVTVQDNGTPVTFSAAITRSLLRYADFMPMLYGLGIISMFLTENKQRTGDLIAGTMVCYAESKELWGKIPYVPPIAPHRHLTVQDQQLLINFAERTHSINKHRQEELAALIPQLAFSEDGGPQGAARLIGIANFLIGREHL